MQHVVYKFTSEVNKDSTALVSLVALFHESSDVGGPLTEFSAKRTLKREDGRGRDWGKRASREEEKRGTKNARL